MTVKNISKTLSLSIDIIGMIILLLGPLILASSLKSALCFLLYLVSWIPAGCLFAFAGWLAKMEDKMMCYKDMTFCRESTCKEFGPCPRTFSEEIRKGAEKWWDNNEDPVPICFYASAPKCYIKRENE